jgi:Fe-S-cluster containining protein
VQLRPADLEKLRTQGWEEKLGMPVTAEFRGTTYLRQRDDGACVFLMDDGLCRIHKEYGFAEKPIACQLFPFVLVPDDRKTHVGISFACQSVRENKGAELRSHVAEIDRMSRGVPETRLATYSAMLADAMGAKEGELDALAQLLDRYLARDDLTMRDRFDGLAWIAASLGRAKLAEILKASPWDLGAHPNQMRPFNTAARLGEVYAPTMIVVGSTDHEYNLAIAGAMQKAMRNTRMHAMLGAGQLLYMDNGAAFAGLVIQFLE